MSGIAGALFAQTAAATGNKFVTGQSLSPTSRNNGGGYSVGMKITVGGSAINVTALGRWKTSGDSATHAVRILNTANTVLLSVSIDMSQAAEADGYVYVNGTVTLSASTAYKVISTEATGVDHFYDSDTTVTPTSVATVNSAWFLLTGTADQAAGGSNNCFVPLNFKY